MIHYNHTKIIFLLLFWIHAFGQELPPIEIYAPQTYGAENQNWAIAQSSDKHIYVANNKGLLEFNGADWQVYNSPNETIIRAVAVNGDKVYTGCYMEFGFWQRNNFGLQEYTSLSAMMPDKMIEDEQIWNIIPLDNWILFQSLDRIYLYNTEDNNFKIIGSSNSIIRMFKVNNTIMFHRINEGIFKIENGKDVLVNSSDIVKDNAILNVFPYGDHYLIQTIDQGLFTMNNESIRKWDIPANEVLDSVSVYYSIQLEDNGFAIGTISNGVIILSSNGEIKYQINQSNGLSNNTVLSLFEDDENNLWLGLDNGINCINKKSPFRIYNDINGQLGTVYASAVFGDNLYLGTNQGLFYRELNSQDKLRFIEGTKGQVWNLVEYNNTLFCGHNSGTFVITDDKAIKVANIMGTWEIKPVPNQPNLLVQGNYDGLYVLENMNGVWQLRNKIKDFDNSSRFFEITSNHSIFVGHEYKGVFDLKIDEDFMQVINTTKSPEFPKGSHSSFEKYNGDYFYAYKEGVFKYDSVSKKFKKDSIISSIIKSNKYVTGKLVVDTKNNRLWGFSDKHISFVSPGKMSSEPEIRNIEIPGDLRRGNTGFENITYIADQTYLLGKSNGYILIDLNKLTEKEYTITLNSIKNQKLNADFVDVDLSQKELIFKNKENNFEFSYSTPEYDKYSNVEYSFKLEGMYDQWSNWSNEPSILFKNLPYGDYTFSVKGRVGNQPTQNISSYSFSIEKPWLISNVMIAIYILGFIIFSFLMHNIYRRYYRKRQEKLLEQTKKELELKDLENKQQLMKFNNEALERDIKNKNRELAISTMSLIKKNEFLGSIKSELVATEGDSNLKSVVKIIDKHLNNTDDWKFFQEAFNNADKDFLKKVKSLHPSLTPNDLKLCAYLRLNLSSKEIAPLLNISPRSVEVKRYRLRKKIQLDHEASLTNYILEI